MASGRRCTSRRRGQGHACASRTRLTLPGKDTRSGKILHASLGELTLSGANRLAPNRHDYFPVLPDGQSTVLSIGLVIREFNNYLSHHQQRSSPVFNYLVMIRLTAQVVIILIFVLKIINLQKNLILMAYSLSYGGPCGIY